MHNLQFWGRYPKRYRDNSNRDHFRLLHLKRCQSTKFDPEQPRYCYIGAPPPPPPPGGGARVVTKSASRLVVALCQPRLQGLLHFTKQKLTLDKAGKHSKNRGVFGYVTDNEMALSEVIFRDWQLCSFYDNLKPLFNQKRRHFITLYASKSKSEEALETKLVMGPRLWPHQSPSTHNAS